MKFANYGFNRSHSVAYALVAYQLAYLKANYPLDEYNRYTADSFYALSIRGYFPSDRDDTALSSQRYPQIHEAAAADTFNTLGAKQVLRDIGKVMRVNQRDIDMLCKQIPFLPKVTLKYAYEQNPPTDRSW